jgi:SAM-dependent methyltransferase
MADAMGSTDVHGVEIIDEMALLAEKRAITVIRADLALPLPIPSSSFDVIHANQVIEHVPDLDVFMSEIYRILRPGGRPVISTENGSSWCNVFAAAMGWQIFSSTNISQMRGGVGNPFALHRSNSGGPPWMRHKTIFNYLGLIEFAEVHGLKNVKCFGGGYFPLPAFVGTIDPRHSHFITIQGTKAV